MLIQYIVHLMGAMEIEIAIHSRALAGRNLNSSWGAFRARKLMTNMGLYAN